MFKLGRFSLVLTYFLISVFLLAGCGDSGSDLSNVVVESPVFNQLGKEYVVQPSNLVYLLVSASVPNNPSAEVIITASGDLADYFVYDSAAQKGEFEWRPGQEDIGAYEITFLAEANGKTTTATVSIVVNIPPIISGIETQYYPDNDGVLYVYEGDVIRAMVHATDTDDFSGNLIYSVLGAPFTHSDLSSNDFNWTTGNGDAGNYTVRFIVNDGYSSTTETINLVVKVIPMTFEDLSVGNKYLNGNTFTSNDISCKITEFYWSNGDSTDKGYAKIDNNLYAGGYGNDLQLNNVNLKIYFNDTTGGLSIDFGEYGGNLNIKINEDFRNFANFEDINGQTIGGVDVSVTNGNGNDTGSIKFNGTIDSFAIGGQELWIDNVSPLP